MLIVAGASPVARALAELGRGAGFAVTAAAAPEDHERLPQADRRIEGFDLGSAAGAASGFVVVATQGKRDREALQAALATTAPYVAFVGSRRKAAALKESLLKTGAAPARLEALHAPAGLDIGAATPEEVALSILAEIVQLRRTAERRPGPPALEREEIDGGSLEAEVVSPVKGACETKGREFSRKPG
ncbi:MAG: XdhC family protein [Kiloniellales bacterium]|nr:XdhC family protein [Kiloniellales bacterium]